MIFSNTLVMILPADTSIEVTRDGEKLKILSIELIMRSELEDYFSDVTWPAIGDQIIVVIS